jgi:hypothetical protein
VLTFVTAAATRGDAQDKKPTSLFGDVVKHVVLDPTTYAPALLGYDATLRDWKSSQPFFQNGYVERNPRFTVSGLAADRAIGYEAGRQQIQRDAWANLQMSLVNNATNAVIDHLLVNRYPEHAKLLRTIGWVERIGFASFMSYRLSGEHYRQWRLNERQAQQLGLR